MNDEKHSIVNSPLHAEQVAYINAKIIIKCLETEREQFQR